MEKENSNLPTRRQVLQVSGTLAAGTILPNIGFGNVHVDGNETIQVAIVGCGGRGGGGIGNELAGRPCASWRSGGGLRQSRAAQRSSAVTCALCNCGQIKCKTSLFKMPIIF